MATSPSMFRIEVDCDCETLSYFYNMDFDHNEFISIDWGTSRLRIHHIRSHEPGFSRNYQSDEGVKHLHGLAQASQSQQQSYFLSFLEDVLQTNFPEMEPGIPIVISGMASSTIGILNLPYATTPYSCLGKDVVYREIKGKEIENRIFLISGVATENDVMRGEETQVIGLHGMIDAPDDKILILPGTHSKHIFISEDRMTHFHTYLTGELFDILTKHSILKNSVTENQIDDKVRHAIQLGGAHGATAKLLNHLFEVRASEILGTRDTSDNFYYLSGLLIGSELCNLTSFDHTNLFLAAANPLAEIYATVAKRLSIDLNLIPAEDIEASVIRGQHQVLNRILTE